MPKEAMSDRDKLTKPQKTEANLQRDHYSTSTSFESSALQNQFGNRVLQRLLAQRSGDSPFDLDDATAERINRARGGGQALEEAIQKQMGEAMSQDFGGVRVHTSPEADALNQQLGAKAFTTGQDIFFREGAYEPHSGSGQELIAHELTHVVQQSSGVVGGNGERMTVNAPGDAFEQEADSVAKRVVSAGAKAEVQRQAEAEAVQRQEGIPEEEEEVVQQQEMPEEEEEGVE